MHLLHTALPQQSENFRWFVVPQHTHPFWEASSALWRFAMRCSWVMTPLPLEWVWLLSEPEVFPPPFYPSFPRGAVGGKII